MLKLSITVKRWREEKEGKKEVDCNYSVKGNIIKDNSFYGISIGRDINIYPTGFVKLIDNKIFNALNVLIKNYFVRSR